MVGALVAFAALGTSIESAAQVSSAAPAPPLIRPHTPTLGPANAKVHLVEFLDPACEGCRAFYPVVKQIIESWGGRILVQSQPGLGTRIVLELPRAAAPLAAAK